MGALRYKGSEGEMVKTRLEWYQDLPEDIRERAVRNTEERYLRFKKESFRDAIYGGFTWLDSPEGQEFWMHVAQGQYDKARELLKNE